MYECIFFKYPWAGTPVSACEKLFRNYLERLFYSLNLSMFKLLFKGIPGIPGVQGIKGEKVIMKLSN